MSLTGQNGGNQDAGYEATLHVVTHASAPDGLEERIHAALRHAPRHARVLDWPGVSMGFNSGNRNAGLAGTSTWLRGVAAAAIVMVVAGGGWGVYRHAQYEAAKAVVPAAQTAPAAGGFSSAGAIRTPETVKGPAVVETPKDKAKKHKAAEAGPAASAGK